MDHGNIATAMRASMSIPAVFVPVEFEGHMLVDGGVVKNLFVGPRSNILTRVDGVHF